MSMIVREVGNEPGYVPEEGFSVSKKLNELINKIKTFLKKVFSCFFNKNIEQPKEKPPIASLRVEGEVSDIDAMLKLTYDIAKAYPGALKKVI